MIWARFAEGGASTGTVAEVFSFPENPHALFLAEWRWVEAPEEAHQGSVFDGEAWDHSAAVTPLDDPTLAEPQPKPIVLGRLQFIVLCQTAGGMTDDMLVEAQKNPAFEAFWIKYQMASSVQRDDPITRGALDALSAGGYLPKGKDAVIAAWPFE